jgi:hypothetical protein
MMEVANQQTEFVKCFCRSTSNLVEQLRMQTTKSSDTEPSVAPGRYNLQQVVGVLLRASEGLPRAHAEFNKGVERRVCRGRPAPPAEEGHAWSHEHINMLPILQRIADHLRDSAVPILPRALGVIHQFMAVGLLRIFMSYMSISKPVWTKLVTLLQQDESEAGPVKALYGEAVGICTDFIEHPELFLLAGSQLPTLKIVLGASLKGDAKVDYIKQVHIVAALAENHFGHAAVKVLDAAKATGGRGGGGGKSHGGAASVEAADGTDILHDDSDADGDSSGSGDASSSSGDDTPPPDAFSASHKGALKRTAAEVHRAFTAAMAKREGEGEGDGEDDPFSESEPRPKTKKARFVHHAAAAAAAGGGGDEGDESADD